MQENESLLEKGPLRSGGQREVTREKRGRGMNGTKVNGAVSSAISATAVSAIAFREEGMWVARGLEVNVVAQAKTLERLGDKFFLALATRMAVREAEGLEPLRMHRAPSKYWELYEKAEAQGPESKVSVNVPADAHHVISAVEMRAIDG